jgi:hypothetical protein
VPTITVGPKLIGFSPTDLSADRPQVERRAGAYYLLHTMRDRDDRLTPYGNPFDDRLDPFGGLSSAVAGATEPYVTAATEGYLGYCFETAAGVTLVGDPSPPLEPGLPNTRVSYGFGGHCQELVTNGRAWFVAFTSELGPRGREPLFMFAERDLMDLLTMPAPAFTETFVPDRELRATLLPDESVAYTAEPTRERLLEVGFVHERTFPRTVVVDDVAPMASPPGIAPWPFDPEAVAIAHNFPDGVRVLVVNRDGAEILRTEPFTFSMGGDVTPAVVALPNALVVASLNYGDYDPNGGLFQMHVVDWDGTVREAFAMETRRSSLRHGGVDALAFDGRAAVHWTEEIPMEAGIGTGTRALILECLEP